MPRAASPARPHLDHENRLRDSGAVRIVAGIDEAGRGPLAGPVVAAAVVLPAGFEHEHLHDSKKLTARRRESIYQELTNAPGVQWACVALDAGEVDRLNILRATHEAMRRAVQALACRPDHALIDGLPVHPFPIPHTAIVEGDGISLSIAAASVIAKVTRDRMMTEFDAKFPAYGFSRHKGYPTRQHLAILARDGPCPIHRRSFRPLAQPSLAFAPDGPSASTGLGRRKRSGEVPAEGGLQGALSTVPPPKSEG